jgi:ribosomal protein S4
MRRIAKFKNFTQSKTIILSCPLKLNTFKRSKWSPYKKLIKNGLKKTKFLDCSLIFSHYSRWEKKRSFFKENLKVKRNLSQLLDHSIKIRIIKRLFKFTKSLKLNYFKVLKHIILNFEFRLDVLLYRLNFFNSIYSARKSINSSGILVNKHLVHHNYLLKKGDLISFVNSKNFNIKEFTILEKKIPSFFSFIELDSYNSNIVIIKDLKDLSAYDFTLFLTKQNDLTKMLKVF